MKEADFLPRKKRKKKIPQKKRKQLYWQYIARTPRRHCFKAEIKCASRPQKKAVSLVTEIIQG